MKALVLAIALALLSASVDLAPVEKREIPTSTEDVDTTSNASIGTMTASDLTISTIYSATPTAADLTTPIFNAAAADPISNAIVKLGEDERYDRLSHHSYIQ